MAPLEAHFEGVVQKVAWHDDRVTLTGWMRHRSLDLTEPPILALSLCSGDRVIALTVEQVTLAEANLWAQLPYAGCAHGGFRVDVPFGVLTGGDRWQLRGVLTSGEITSTGAFHERIPGSSGEHPGGTAGIEASWDPSDGFSLQLVPRPAGRLSASEHVLVHAVELGDGEIRLQVSGIDATDRTDVALRSARVELSLIDVGAAGASQVVRFNVRASEFGAPPLPAPCGDYEFTIDHHPVVAADDLAGQLPLRLRGADLTVEVSLERERTLRLSVVRPLRDDELGQYHQFRQQAAYQRAKPLLANAILYTSQLGESCTDSQLAIDRHLAETGSDLERIWGVRDHSVAVPEGARPVLLDTAEWYDAVASSRYLCRNVDFGPWLRLRPDQAYLQTFQGHPFESMGRDRWRSKGFPPGRVRHLASRASSEWDLILVPSDEGAAYYREQYGYTGAVLAAGYPRTDALVNADAARVRCDVLARLGVPGDRTVVLYAPADRDGVTTDIRTGRPYQGLDVTRLSRQLGPQYVLLVRGSDHQLADRSNQRASIVDITDHPEINDLVLAADVAVLDYSSLRFDWAITGKPMIFFVPDLESYVSLHAPLFPFEESAPGPWARTTSELAGHLADVDQLATRHADNLRDFNARFNRLNDGHATERVLACFLDETIPWRNQ
jgi:CDP-glycerol glycerophosphotransferase